MTARQRRGLAIAGLSAAFALAVALVLNALNSNLVFFLTPSEVLAGQAPARGSFRIGGLVERGSLRRDGPEVSFVIRDRKHHMPVSYRGILPDLFAEEQGAVAFGRMDDSGRFRAEQVLAKHDETYMPPEIAAKVAQQEGARLP